MSRLLSLITGEDPITVYCDPGTALIVMGIGTLIGVGADIYQGNKEKELAEDQAEQNEVIASAQYGLAKDEGTAQLEQLRDEEVKAKGGLLQGAANAGVKINRDEIQDVSRSDIATLINDMEGQLELDAEIKREKDKGKDAQSGVIELLEAKKKEHYGYTGGTSTIAGSTLEALSNDISKQITEAEKSVMRNLSNAKLGLDDALFNAQMLREQGQLSQIAGWFNAGSTLLTGASNIYAAGKSPSFGVW